MSNKVFQITEVGEKMIVDAFEATVEHGYPPPSHPAGDAEKELRVLCGYIILNCGVHNFGQIVKDAGLDDLERADLLLSFATINLGFRLHDMKLVEAVSMHLTKVGLAERVAPILDMSGIDAEHVGRDIEKVMADPKPEPFLEITVTCCDKPGTECCENEMRDV